MAAERSVAEVRRLIADASERRLAALLDELASDRRAGVKEAVEQGRRRLSALRAERRRITRMYAVEEQLRAEGLSLLVGVDEVGRGALAGPLTAAAVALPTTPRVMGLDDSKRLAPEARESVARRVREVALGWSVCHVDATEIDALGMAAALKTAMTRAVEGLDLGVPDRILLDGLPLGLSDRESAFVGGDGRVAAIAAASCVAKVARDALMRAMDEAHPGWGFSVNKGYGTPEHLRAISSLGLSPIHRRSFAPCGGTARLF